MVVVHLNRLEDALSGGVGVEEVVDLFLRRVFFSSSFFSEFFFSRVERERGKKNSKKSTPPPTQAHLDVLVLVLLVVLEEALDLGQAVLRQLRDVGEAAVLGVVGMHRDDLVVLLALVHHLSMVHGGAGGGGEVAVMQRGGGAMRRG